MRTFLLLRSRSVMESLLERDMVKFWTRPRLSDDDDKMKGVTVRPDSYRHRNLRRHRARSGSSIHVPFHIRRRRDRCPHAHMRVRPCLEHRFQAHLVFSQLHWNKTPLAHREYKHAIPHTRRSRRSSMKGRKSYSEKPRRAPLRFPQSVRPDLQPRQALLIRRARRGARLLS